MVFGMWVHLHVCWFSDRTVMSFKTQAVVTFQKMLRYGVKPSPHPLLKVNKKQKRNQYI